MKREVRSRGIIDVLRRGISHNQHRSINLFYGSPTPGNTTAEERYTENRFSVTRQLRYSNDEKQRALDLALFINGLPITTFELKNNLTKQTVSDAVQQYRQSRNPREDLFQVGRCAVHFCRRRAGSPVLHETCRQSLLSFCPSTKVATTTAPGNPVNPNGLKTDYLWQEVLTPGGLTDIIENYAQKVGDSLRSGPVTTNSKWCASLLQDAASNGAGKRYLIQHSAGSGKSNSIAWLARQIIELANDSQTLFDSILIVTDRRVLDTQITETIRQFTQVSSTVGHAETSSSPQTAHHRGKEDRHHDGPEVPLNNERYHQRTPRTKIRHHHRRSSLQSRRAYRRRHELFPWRSSQ